MDYIFPFTTCETVKAGVSQPYSVAANAAILAVLAILLARASTAPVRALIGALMVFETVHLLSHAIHVRSSVQTVAIHAVAYGIGLALWWAVHVLSAQRPAAWIGAAIVALWLVDVWIFVRWRGLASVLSGVFWIFAILLLHLPYLPAWAFAWPYLYGMALLAAVGVALFFNEHLHCRAMLARFPFPYHVLVEAVSGLFIVCLVRLFLRWEAG